MSTTAPRVDPARQCYGKVRHLSRRAARRARKVTAVDAGRHLTIYRCPWCDFLHLGTAWTGQSDPALADMHRRQAEREDRLELDDAAALAAARVLGITEEAARRLLVSNTEEDPDG